ncbi:MAG: hypothetical protein GX962_12620 [Epulopiscium sp.]|nr:hypothetical protein [Candidatus Epulonipiscium sp.]
MIKRIVTALYEKPKPKFNLKDQKMNSNFTTLAPKVFEGENLADNNIYLDSLKEAIQIKENKNIALMGGYGSGKSSILKTFEKGNPKHNYLFLSLASFLDKENAEKDCGEQKAVVDNEKPRKWETIEKILVKQMIYKKAIKDLPYSRFKRISAVPTWSLWLNALGLVTLISLITFYEFILKMLTEPDKLSIIMFISILLLSTYFVGWILSYGSKVLKLSKFSFKSFTIEPSYDDTSYFSKYLDEIIYFFEVSKTDIVVIEDIDRFNSITIFEHLRELNYLLNNSEQINQDIRFIYAIRDDLFTSEGEPNLKESEEYLRTKFFDFIIPVIPVVDYSNSRNFLVPKVMSIIKGYSENIDNELKDNEESIGKDVSINNGLKKFLWDISLYIDDLRIIYNICNEFEVYLKRQSHIKTIDKIKKLFALVVYKNIYPKDFSALQHNHGMLYNVFNSIKKNLLRDKRSAIMKQIQSNKDIIEGGTYEVSLSAGTAILGFGLRYFKNDNIGSLQYSVDNHSFKSLIPLTNDKINEFLQAREYVQIRFSNSSKKTKITKSELVKQFHDFGVHTNNIIEKLEEKKEEEIKELIHQWEKEVDFIDATTIQELVEDDNNSIVTEEFKGYKLLMKYLLGSGYIDEQYNYYISNIYEKVLSANDVSVIQKIKSNTPLNKTDKITNYDLALYELSENDYKKPAILNNNIILYIFGKDNLTREQNSMISIFAHKIEKIKQIKLLEELFKEDNDLHYS